MNTSSVEITKQFLKEATLLQQFNHKNIMSLIGIAKLKGQYVTVVPYMANGDVRKYVKESPKEVREVY